MATATASPNKTNFVKEFLQGNPQANAKAVNEAWHAAGFEGTIGHPTVSEARKELGLIGTQPGKTRKAAKEASPQPAQKSDQGPGQDKFRDGVPEKQSTGQRPSRERGVDGCWERRVDRLHAHPQADDRSWG